MKITFIQRNDQQRNIFVVNQTIMYEEDLEAVIQLHARESNQCSRYGYGAI